MAKKKKLIGAQRAPKKVATGPAKKRGAAIMKGALKGAQRQRRGIPMKDDE